MCVNEAFSRDIDVSSGVPQGGALSPLLFLLYINDLPSFLGNNVSTKMFADDTKIYFIFNKGESTELFKRALDKFCTWSRRWQLSVAFNKCNVLSLGHGNPKSDYYFEDIMLENVDSVTDLGICISQNLKPSQYCRLISSRALARCSVVFRSFKTANISVLLKAYTTFVRPLLEYETSVWSPFLKGDIETVEKVQRTFTRRMFERCKLPPTEYKDRLVRLGLVTLEARRARNDLVNTFKILKGFAEVNVNDFFVLSHNRHTRGHDMKLYPENSRIDVRRNFFSARVVPWWNKLPDRVVSARSVNSFKHQLDSVNLNNIVSSFIF